MSNYHAITSRNVTDGKVFDRFAIYGELGEEITTHTQEKPGDLDAFVAAHGFRVSGESRVVGWGTPKMYDYIRWSLVKVDEAAG